MQLVIEMDTGVVTGENERRGEMRLGVRLVELGRSDQVPATTWKQYSTSASAGKLCGIPQPGDGIRCLCTEIIGYPDLEVIRYLNMEIERYLDMEILRCLGV